MESDRIQLESGNPVCNAIYTYPGRNKSNFYVNTQTTKTVTVSMRTVTIPNLDVHV